MRWLGVAPARPLTMGGAFEHFLLHTGGRGVLDVIETKLGLTPEQVRPLSPSSTAWAPLGRQFVARVDPNAYACVFLVQLQLPSESWAPV